jgi:hypothetical protein
MTSLTFCVEPTNTSNNIKLEVWIDQTCIHQGDVKTSVNITHELEDNNADHVLEIRMLGKTADDTKINSDGSIISDVMLNLSKFALDNISIDQVVFDQAVYQHDFNGSSTVIQDRFYGNMGCNGIVSLKFFTPVYAWLLEHM